MAICISENLDTYEVVATFCMLRGYCTFEYLNLPECRVKPTPSKIRADNSTLYVGPSKVVKGYLDHGPWISDDGEFLITLRNMNRRNAGAEINRTTGEVIGESYFVDKSNMQADGTRKIGFDTNEYLYRSYRLDVRGDGNGVQLDSVLVNMGGLRRLFPNVGVPL